MPPPEHRDWLDNLDLEPLPEGSIITGALVALQTLGDDGRTYWVWRHNNEISSTEILGVCHLMAALTTEALADGTDMR